MKSKVIVRSLKFKSLEDSLLEILKYLNWDDIIKINSNVVIKLNLCAFEKERVREANTSPELIKSLCKILKTRTNNIFLVESHSYRAPAEVAFENTGIYELAKEINVKVVNLSKEKIKKVDIPFISGLPEILLKADVFITLPKLKTHALTYFTGSLKNQWGCIPDKDRIKFHHSLDYLIYKLNKILKPDLCIMDGIIGMDDRGPTNGRARQLDIILGSKDPVALDATAMRLVGLNPNLAKHVVLAYKNGLGKFKEEEIDLDINFQKYWSNFKPAELDWAVALMNYLTKYRFFRDYILGVNFIFYPTKKLVNFLRKIGIVRPLKFFK